MTRHYLDSSLVEEYVNETLEENSYNITVNEAVNITIKECLRDFFKFDAWDNTPFKEAIAKYADKCFLVTIEDDGCVEVTNNHRIIHWDVKIKELSKEEIENIPKQMDFRTYTYNEVYSRDLEELIEEVYGKRICIAAETEWSYNVPNMIDVDGEYINGDDDFKQIENFKNTSYMDYETIDIIMNDLCRRGHFPVGKYGIYIEH